MSFGDERDKVLFRYDTWHLYELEIFGFLLGVNNDFVTITDQGLKLVALGAVQKR